MFDIGETYLITGYSNENGVDVDYCNFVSLAYDHLDYEFLENWWNKYLGM